MFDEPLSSVDQAVACHIYEKLFGATGFLRHKVLLPFLLHGTLSYTHVYCVVISNMYFQTRILVMSDLKNAPHYDQVITLKRGRIQKVEHFTPKKLLIRLRLNSKNMNRGKTCIRYSYVEANCNHNMALGQFMRRIGNGRLRKLMLL